MKNKLTTPDEFAALINDGDEIMYGGFLGVGTPDSIVDAIIRKGVKDLTVIGNDTSVPNRGIAKLIERKMVKKVITSHVGTNPQTGAQMTAGTLEVCLVPQGTLIERIRAGGYGLGGILTPTGVGTEVANGKQVLNVNGKDYLLELPLRARIGIIRGSVVDEHGNVYYKGTTRNFNPLVAMACDIVVVEAEKLLKTGEIEPEHIMTPGILVDYLVVEGEQK